MATPKLPKPAAKSAQHVPAPPSEIVPTPSVAEDVSSTLAAEVARLDAARAVSRAGHYAETVRLIERFHLEFPSGAFVADAEVVAIEALAQMRNHPEVARRAKKFLSLDPHAERVRRLGRRPLSPSSPRR